MTDEVRRRLEIWGAKRESRSMARIGRRGGSHWHATKRSRRLRRRSRGASSRRCAAANMRGAASIALPNTTFTTETVAAGAFPSPQLGWGCSAPITLSCPSSAVRVDRSSRPRTPTFVSRSGCRRKLERQVLADGQRGRRRLLVYPSLADPLSRGYAVANTDTGHQAGGGDFAWAADHPEKLTDYQYRAVHEPRSSARP